MLVALAALVVLPIVHELIHGAVAALLGGRPVYGIGPGVAFCHFREFVGKWPYAAIIVAPLLVISLGGALPDAGDPHDPARSPPRPHGDQRVGAVGDLASLWQLVRFPGNILIADTNAGFEVYEPDTAVPRLNMNPLWVGPANALAVAVRGTGEWHAVGRYATMTILSNTNDGLVRGGMTRLLEGSNGSHRDPGRGL